VQITDLSCVLIKALRSHRPRGCVREPRLGRPVAL
jgi:hypothetical protein